MNTIKNKIKTAMVIAVCIASSLVAQEGNDDESNAFLRMNSAFSYKMLESNQNLRKVELLLNERQKGTLENKSLTVGASLITIMDYQRSNTDSKFAYLMRHPTSNNQIGKEVSEAVVHSFQLSFTGTVNNWITLHSEILYNPEQSFGTGTITALGRNQLQLRKGFVLLGDQTKSPIYFALGKMDAPFGYTGSVSPFTNSTLWHAFGGLGFGAQIGYKKSGLHAVFMAVQGGSQFRALHTPVGDATKVPSKLNNFTADINYTFNIKKGVNFKLGTSYMHGSAYCQGFPVTHFEPCSDNNPAYTVYGKLNISERLFIEGGFAETLEVWPGTFNPTPPLDVFEASKVSSLDIGSKYYFNNSGKVNYSLSAEFSNFKAGPDGAPWERQNQIIVGFSGSIYNASKLFVEFFRTDGYAPLNFISGSAPDAPFPPGETHSSKGAFSYGIVLGGQFTL